MKKFALALTVLALSSLSFAGDSNPKNVDRDTPLPSINCEFTFTAGASNTFLRYCVTDGGNILGIEGPQGHFMVPDNREGYGVCDESTGVAYDDYGSFGDTGNWGPATVVSHSAKSVKIARTTNDGIWTLTQTISQVTGNTPMAKASMTLKNNTGVDRIALLMRYADVDADGVSENSLDGTRNSAFGWNPAGSGITFGLALQNVGTSPFHEGFAQNVPQGPAPCTPFANIGLTTLTATDGSLVMLYDLHVPKGASKTVTVSYRGL